MPKLVLTGELPATEFHPILSSEQVFDVPQLVSESIEVSDVSEFGQGKILIAYNGDTTLSYIFSSWDIENKTDDFKRVKAGFEYFTTIGGYKFYLWCSET
tara:strand:+ start:897 stop:1196 length:300 start_codon:yes stop_codon:yes gene_type:complete